MTSLRNRLPIYGRLMRVDRPIGTFLLLWPTLWALWLAAEGLPDWNILLVFYLGTFLMRSAGCVINDYADRKIDKHIERTRHRPLANAEVDKQEALLLFAILCVLAFIVVLFTNVKTILLSFVAITMATLYPFMKRYTHLPQLVLGAAFAWSVPMAFAAQTNSLPTNLWLIYIAALIWTLVYDTFYAMVDRDDDLKVGVKSTAILFGDDDLLITRMLQAVVVVVLIFVGLRFELGIIYYCSLVLASGFFVYQQYLIRNREKTACFNAFLNNNWFGMVIFAGIAFHYAFGEYLHAF